MLVRTALYLAALAARRRKEHKKAMKARMRKLLVTLNAIVRDNLAWWNPKPQKT